MNLTILAIGSRGDVQPCVALGAGLRRAGHEVRVVTLESFETMVRGQGLDFLPVAGDAQALVNTMLAGKKGAGGLCLLPMYRAILRSFGAIVDDYRRALADERLRDADAILSQLPGGLFGYDLSEALGVPYIALSVIPQETTAAWPLALLPGRRSLGGTYNRLTYRLGQQLVWRAFRPAVNGFRAQLGLGPAGFWEGNMGRMRREKTPVVQGFSERVVPRPPDCWRPQAT